MSDSDKTKAELMADAEQLHQRVIELEASAAQYEQQLSVVEADQERLRQLYENAPLGYQSLNAEGDLLSVNPAWLSVLGYTRDEVIGKWFGDFLGEHHQEAFRHRFPCFKQEGAIDGVEFDMLHKDGQTVTVMFNGKIGYNVDGSFMQTHCIMQDVTDRRQAEEKVVDLAKFPSENPHPVLRVASDGRVIYANAPGNVLLQNQPDPDVAQAPVGWMETLSEALNSDSPAELEEQSGGRILSLMFAPVVDSSYVNIYAHDITDRKQTEERVADLAKFPSENPHPVLRVASDGRVIYANAPGNVLLQNQPDPDVTQAPAGWLETIAAALDSNSPAELEVQSDDRILNLMFAPVADSGYVNIYAPDITERQRAEEARRESERSYRDVVEGTGELITRADAKGGFTDVTHVA